MRRETSAGTPPGPVVRLRARERGEEDVHGEGVPQIGRGRGEQIGQRWRAARVLRLAEDLLDAFRQEPERAGIPGQPAPLGDEFVDVLVRHGQVEEQCGQVVGVRQHGRSPFGIRRTASSHPLIEGSRRLVEC